MNTLQYNDRFKDAPWYEKCLDEKILLCGLGGIGSSSLYCLTKTIPATYYIIDYDTVDSVNVGCQFFNKNDVGKPKVIAITEMAKSYSTTNTIQYNYITTTITIQYNYISTTNTIQYNYITTTITIQYNYITTTITIQHNYHNK